MSFLSCVDKIIKFVLIVVNLFIVLVGLALLGIGIWVIIDKLGIRLLQITEIDENIPKHLINASAYIFIAVGVCLFLVGFLGCCGAWKKSPCMLFTYGCIVLVLLLAQLAAGVVAVVQYDKVVETFRDACEDFVKTKYDGNSTLSSSWSILQQQIGCCGSESPSDWGKSKWQKTFTTANSTLTIPLTCCVVKSKENINNPEAKDEQKCEEEYKKMETLTTFKYLNKEGCYKQVFKLLKSNMSVVIAIAFTLLIVQIALSNSYSNACGQCRETVCTIFMMVFGMIRSGREPTTYRVRSGHANH